MIRPCGFFAFGILLAGTFMYASTAAAAEGALGQTNAASPNAVKPAKIPESNVPSKETTTAAAKPKRELSPALIALRDGVRRTLARYEKQPLNTQQNSATEIMNYCLAFGCRTEVLLDGSNGRRLNGITCLCWDYPCAGFKMLGPSERHLAARLAYGCQEHPGEFLAMLAMSGVQANYPARAGHQTKTVADLVEAEKLGYRSGSDMSLKLIGLSYYVDEPQWQNDLGETWSIERMLQDEMAQPATTAAEGGVNRLLGISYAVARREKRGEAIEGQFQRAKKYIAEFQEFALQLQNADGSWGPSFLVARSSSPDATVQLRSSGRILEWLAMSLPDGQLEDAKVIKSVEYVIGLLGSQRYQRNLPVLSTREIAAVGHALHGLAEYDDRVLKPADADAKPAAEAKQPSTTQRDAKGSKTR